jgi:PAS domain S-box-containing protein
MAAAVSRCSRDFRYVWVSSALASWLRRSKDQIEGHYIWDVIGEQAYGVILPYMERVLAGERVEYTTEVNYLGAGTRWIHAVYVPTSSQGQVDGWIAVVTDVTDTVRYEEQLREANAELARANDDLNQFAFAASHDLQEPLRMITSYSQMLLKGYRGRLDSEAAICVGYITEGTKRMRELLADLLAYTQVSGSGQEAMEPVDLNLVFQQTLENCKAAIEESHASLSSDPLPVVTGHNPHFVELFQNVIGNALKYRSERPPNIHVSAVEENGMWRLGVADNGIGIDPQYHQNVFGVFKRLHGKTIPGTGIGLAICQRVVERNGGRIWVESQAGQGATFYFTLPTVKVIAAHGN